MQTSRYSVLAWGGVLLAGALWGAGAVVGRLLLERGFSPLGLALARFALGLPLLWWWHLRRPVSPLTAGEPRRLGWRDRALVAGTGVAMALSVSCWLAGIASVGASLATVIAICCAPVLVALVSVARGYERMSRRLLLALSLAVAGVALLSLPAAGLAQPASVAEGLAWSFATAVLQALVVLGNARTPSRLPASTASAWSMTAAACFMAILALPRGVPWPAAGWDWLGVAYIGIGTGSVAYLLFAWGARRLTPTASAVAIMIEPLVTTLLATWLLAESLTPRQWAGAALLGAAMLPLAAGRRRLAARAAR